MPLPLASEVPSGTDEAGSLDGLLLELLHFALGTLVWRIQLQASPAMYCQMLAMPSERRSSSFKLSLSFTRSRRACCSSSIEERRDISPGCRDAFHRRVSKVGVLPSPHQALLSLSQCLLQMLLVHLELLAKVFHVMELSAWIREMNDQTRTKILQPACSCL